MMIAVNVKFPCDWAREGSGKLFQKSVENVIFSDVWAQWNLTPDFYLHSILLHHINSGKKWERVLVETCQLPFTSTEECWRGFTMLSVSTADKSVQFINKIDDIAYHQFLLCVFPYKLRGQKASALSHQLTSSPPQVQTCLGVLAYSPKPHYSRIHFLAQLGIKKIGRCFLAGTEKWL